MSEEGPKEGKMIKGRFSHMRLIRRRLNNLNSHFNGCCLRRRRGLVI